mmetsp:Transcript_33642/g.66992  ORF Transcript_33642/g.66992 Transcript_33642/m.66992 type:complete len:229 (-) Transcript_33642:1522-2208(-)
MEPFFLLPCRRQSITALDADLVQPFLDHALQMWEECHNRDGQKIRQVGAHKDQAEKAPRRPAANRQFQCHALDGDGVVLQCMDEIAIKTPSQRLLNPLVRQQHIALVGHCIFESIKAFISYNEVSEHVVRERVQQPNRVLLHLLCHLHALLLEHFVRTGVTCRVRRRLGRHDICHCLTDTLAKQPWKQRDRAHELANAQACVMGRLEREVHGSFPLRPGTVHVFFLRT